MKNKLLLLSLSLGLLLGFAGVAFASDELTPVQTVSPLADQILVWLSVAMTIITVLANTLPPSWPLTQLLARLSTDLRGIRKPDPAKVDPSKTGVLMVLLVSLLGGCAAHPLSEVADRVPVVLRCQLTDGSAARAALAEYVVDREALRSRLVEQAKRDPISVACLLLDARALVIAEGKRLEPVYRDIQDGLEALEVN